MTHLVTGDRKDREFVLGDELHAVILTTGEESEGRFDLLQAVQPAGAKTPLHLHTRYEERFWVISGSMTVWAGPEKAVLHSGDFYAVPRNTPHAVHAGPEGSRALLISSPAGFAELIARAGVPARLAGDGVGFDDELFAAGAAELGDVDLAWPRPGRCRPISIPERRAGLPQRARPSVRLVTVHPGKGRR
jgi:mannose-6-phosphate isomerase-like protein (cupin superfamily)